MVQATVHSCAQETFNSSHVFKYPSCSSVLSEGQMASRYLRLQVNAFSSLSVDVGRPKATSFQC